jgi:hypothetical protein
MSLVAELQCLISEPGLFATSDREYRLMRLEVIAGDIGHAIRAGRYICCPALDY